MSAPDLPERSIIITQHLAAAGVDVDIRVLPDSARTAWAAAGHPHTVMPLTFELLKTLTRGEIIAVTN